MSSTLRELLDIPREAAKTSFVVKLTDAVEHADVLMGQYAVTPSIVNALDHALDLVRVAVRDRISRATYVHGSFGSGKSHFMAAVSLLLGDHPTAWSVPEIHPLRVKHAWVAETKLLRLHLHMTGADSLEAQLFRAYLDAVRASHPRAPVPALFADHELFANADALRAQVGDATFFAKLQGSDAESDGWGTHEGDDRWDAARFERVRTGDHEKDRAALFDALVRSWFPAFTAQTQRWVDADRGFAVLSRHAAELGYHGVVVFFDELILWLTHLAADRNRLNSEVVKLAKLVEAQDLRRPIPLVGFAARQRDIAEMVGHQFVGGDAQLLTDTLKFWEGRLETIKLEDRNLPAIIRKRVVRPRDEAARQRLDQGFQELLRKLTPQEKSTLLGELGDEKALRDLHPFSPALVEALVAMSGFLQRDRTALKILLELLLEHLEDYQFGRIVPVGDLFDVLAGGEEPMDGTMRARWQAAKRLYQSELLPVIQTRHDTARPERCQRMRDEHRPEIGCSNCRESACRADNRLLKTLLLAALVPEVPVLRNLTVSRLVQLNHGTLREVIPGTAGQQATARLRQYAGDVGKLRVGEEGDPRLSIAIDGVDIKPILDGARNYDTQGARKAMLRELLFRALGFERHEGSPVDLEVTWRGFTRNGQVYYGNVREMDRAHFAVPHGYDFRVVIDFPFDDPARTPQEDERHVIALRDKGLEATTVVWLPSFFSDRLQRELGELVVLDRVSAPENRAKHLQHLREEDRRAAELEMESLQSQKRNRVLSALDMAYGLRTRDAESIDESRRVDRNFHVLVPDARVTIPTETKLSSALASVVRNLLEARYPRHPDFDHDASISRRRLEEALKRVQEVSLADNQRVAFDRGEAKPFEIAQRMGFLHVNESSATVRIDRAQEIENRLRDRGIESPTVAQVRAAFDPENLAGMTPELADFCALAFAALQGRELFRDDRAVADAPTLGKVADELTLVRPRLPDTAAWNRALALLGTVFGLPREGLRTCSGRSLRKLADECAKRRATAVKDGADRVATALARWETLGAAPGTPRRETAESAATLVRLLGTHDPLALVEVLAGFAPKSSEAALEKHFTHAPAVLAVLEKNYFLHGLEALRGVTTHEASALAEEVRQTLAHDELNAPLARKIEDQALRAQRLMAPPPRVVVVDPPVVEVPPLVLVTEAPPTHPVLVAEGQAVTFEAFEREVVRLRTALAEAGPSATLAVNFRWTLHRPRGE
jgi:hypothetical protein